MYTKQCFYCGEEIAAAAKKCKYCGEWLDNVTMNTKPQLKSSFKKTIMAIIIVSIVIFAAIFGVLLSKTDSIKMDDIQLINSSKIDNESFNTFSGKTYVERLKKEIVGSYSYTITEDYDQDENDVDYLITTINGKIVFKSNGTCEDTGTIIETYFSEDGEESKVKYQFEAYGKYEIINSYIIYDYKLENIGIKLIQTNDHEWSKYLDEHIIPELKHEWVINNKYKIIELNNRILKTENEYEDEIETITYVRLSN